MNHGNLWTVVRGRFGLIGGLTICVLLLLYASGDYGLHRMLNSLSKIGLGAIGYSGAAAVLSFVYMLSAFSLSASIMDELFERIGLSYWITVGAATVLFSLLFLMFLLSMNLRQLPF